MNQLTLEHAAINYNRISETADNTLAILEQRAFKAGAEWQKEQNMKLLTYLKGIAEWPGNLPDDRLTSKTGPNDAVARGLMVCAMREIAIEAVKRYEPDYAPFKIES